MKIYLFIIMFLFFSKLISSQCACGGSLGPQEFYMYFKDNPGANYRIYATKFGNSPIYDKYFHQTENYNIVWGQTDATCNPVSFYASLNEYTTSSGLDWVPDALAGQGCRGVLGFGFYQIEFQRETSPGSYDFQTVFSFYFDVRQTTWSFSPDLTFYFDYNYGSMTLTVEKSGSNNPRNVPPSSLVELWAELGIQKDWSGFIKNPTILNDFSGAIRNDINTTLLAAVPGFPMETYPIGYQFSPGNTPNFWKEAIYKFSVPSLVTHNNIQYRARSWNSQSIYGDIVEISIAGNEIKTFYNPTIPLTVTNNLEGGTGGSYKVSWDKQSDIHTTLNSGSSYNAFEYQTELDDKYDIQALNFSALNTNWYFQNWDDGTTTNPKTGLLIQNPTSYDANYKGNLRSNQTDALTGNNQRKIIRDGSGIYHAVYTSMDKLWYTKSLTTNFNGNWSEEQKILIIGHEEANYTHPSIDIYGNILAIVFDIYYPSEDGMVYLLEMNITNGNITTADSAPIDDSRKGNANPVVSYDQYHRIYIYDKSSTDGLSYKRSYFLSGSSWSGWLDEELIPNTTSLSKNPSIAGRKIYWQDFHLVWQEGSSSIRYIYIKKKTDHQLWFTSYGVISSGNGYALNEFPSISLMESYYDPIVSWTAKRKEQQVSKISDVNSWVWVNRMVTLPGTYDGSSSVTWGNFYITGSNVGFTNNNSTSGSTAETVIAWSQSNGAVSKWLRRTGTTYSAVSNLSHNGNQIQISNSSTLSTMKGLVLSNGDLPYILQRTTTDFQPLYKISGTNGPTYSRTGVVYKNSLEFVFNIGDILLNEENVLFIERADTLPVASITEMNEALNTNTFSLNSNSELLFSNYYYVVNPELADSMLTEDDEVTFIVQLVNADNNQVVGTFDKVTYNRTNVGDYDNINYTVDCSGVEDGNYYFRLITSVEGNSLFFLSNVQNDAENLGKKKFTNINFDGTVGPKTYELSQNYPNPFNPNTIIRYQIPQDGIVTLKVYDILGREVTTLVNEQKAAGRYEVNFNASHLASGVYIYKLQASNYVSSRKMILIK